MKMAKLKAKEWMTIPEAASFLNHIAGQEQTITEWDILHYAASGDLTLSIKTFSRVPGIYGYFYPRGSRPPQPETNPPDFDGKVFYLSQASKQTASQLRLYEAVKKWETEEPDPNAIWEGPALAAIDEESALQPGVWDILYTTMAQEYLESHWKRCTEERDLNPAVPLNILSANFVKIDERGAETSTFELCLVEPEQAGAALVKLPDLLPGSILCIRPQALEALFEASPTSNSSELSTKEKKTYLRVIRALCEHHQDIDLSKNSTAAAQVIAMADYLGLPIPSKRTLEELLKEARDLED